MVGRVLYVMAVLTARSPVPLFAQDPSSATDVTWTEIEAVLNSPEGGASTDRSRWLISGPATWL